VTLIAITKISNSEDLQKVFAIRKTVFVEEQNCPPELEWENEDVSIHFLAKYNGENAGACRWRKTDKGYKLERFAVLKEFRGKGIAQKMIKAVLHDLPKNANYIYLHAQLTAVPLYQKMGFVVEGDQFEEAGIQHYKMIYTKPLTDFK
jgi:predicted GNAT family N-acyltransferase